MGSTKNAQTSPISKKSYGQNYSKVGGAYFQQNAPIAVESAQSAKKYFSQMRQALILGYTKFQRIGPVVQKLQIKKLELGVFSL